MNRILDIDTDNLMVVVEPAVVTNSVDRALEPHGLFFAGYPISEDICFTGANVAGNAGGGRAIKYGVTAGYVLGAQVVTPTGDVLNLGGKRLNDVTGYSLLQLFVGSEGTLGLFTRITLRVIPRPTRRAVALIGFARSEDAARCVSALRANPTVHPSSIEFIDGPTARITNAATPAGARVVASQSGGEVIVGGTDGAMMEQAWKLRKQVPWFVKCSCGRFHRLEDVAVPPAAVPDQVAFVAGLRDRHAMPGAMFGHARDGSFHARP